MISTKKLSHLLAVILTFALVAAACGGADDDDAAVSEDPIEATDNTDPAGEGDSIDDEDANTDDADDPEEDDVSSTEDPVAGGTLRVGIQAESDGLNPTSSALAASGHNVVNAVFDRLARFDQGGNVVPYLAESFTPNQDFTSWTIKLREGIEFHDGTPLNADAAILNFETQLNDPLIGIAVRPFVDPDTPIEKVDELTYTVNLTDPNAFFPATGTTQLGLVASPAWLAAALEDPTLNQEPVGTGPFVFESRTEDQVTRFVRNDNYWNGEVYLAAIEFVVVTDADTRVNLFLEGQLDGMLSNDPATVDVLNNEDGVQNANDATGSEQMVVINSEAPPFDDIRARQALTFATPQNNYVTLLGVGVAERANSLFDPDSPYYNPDVIQETDQPERAIEVATEYCADVPENCTGGKINMDYGYGGPDLATTREAELLKEGWDVAFNVSLMEVAQDTGINNVVFGLYQAADWRSFGAVDPVNDNVWLMCRTVGGISLNFPRFCDEDRDALLLEAQITEDPAARAELYRELSAKLQQDYLYIFETHTIWDIAYAEGVGGYCALTNPEGVALRCQNQGVTFYNSLWLAQ